MKKRKDYLVNFDLVSQTAGKICNGVYISKDKQEIIIQFAWGGKYLHFRPLKTDEVSL